MSAPADPTVKPKPARRRRPVTWQTYLVVGGVIVLALIIATVARGGLSPALIGVVPLVLVLAIGILVRRSTRPPGRR
jgi:hypothetical protein